MVESIKMATIVICLSLLHITWRLPIDSKLQALQAPHLLGDLTPYTEF